MGLELKKLCFILCLKLHSSSFNVIIVSLNGSRKCKIEEIELVLRHTPYDHYADSLQIDKNINLLNFCSNFEWVNKKLKQRKLSVIEQFHNLVFILMVQTMDNFVNINLSSENHGLKQLNPCGILKMKKKEVDFVLLWNRYLTWGLVKKLVPN